MSTVTCEPLEGNADFYGLGIRIGIYLQWGAAWLSLLLDSESAQGVLDANSVSVFAVVVATIIAARRDAPAIEMYIMLQILLGFHITILSSFGIRIWLMNPNRLNRFLAQIEKLWRVQMEEWKESARQRAEEIHRRRESLRQNKDRLEGRIRERRVQGTPGAQSSVKLADLRDRMGLLWLQTSLIVESDGAQGALPNWIMRVMNSGPSISGLLYLLWHFPVELLRLLSSLKFPGLSWSGVLWRTTIMALIMGYNLAYWFDEGLHGVNEPPADGCGSPVIFMFSMQRLLGTAMITLGKVSAILIAVLVIPPTFTLVMLSFRIFFYAIVFLYRDLIWSFVDLINLKSDTSRFNESLGRVNDVFRKKALPLLEAVGFLQPLAPFGYIIAGQVIAVRSMLDLIEFMSSTGHGAIRFSDVIKVGISLGMGNPVRRERNAQSSEPGPQQLSRGQTMSSGWEVKPPGRSWLKPTCFAWNVMVVLSIAYFIISIETTIRWNNIQGVNTIDSTGQLIPFIIGCISASQVIRKVVLLALGKYFPDWAEAELEIEDGSDGPVILRTVKRSRDNDATGTLEDGVAEGVTTVENGSNSN